MTGDHTHTAGRECDGLCHLNDRAWSRYWELMRGNCPEQAENMSRNGVWS